MASVSVKHELFANYEALSYTWDSEMLTRNISVNDSQLRITENLFEALRHLRDKRREELYGLMQFV
jgi:hypothetical protein